jgi:hypothetical protein
MYAPYRKGTIRGKASRAKALKATEQALVRAALKQQGEGRWLGERRMRAVAKAGCRVVDIVRREAEREDEMLQYPGSRDCLFAEFEDYGFEKIAAERVAY